MSATIGTSVRLRISYIAAAASSSGTAIRTISQPASTISSICRNVPSTSVVSVFVIDCTITGAPPPIWMLRTLTGLVTLAIKLLFAHQPRNVEERDRYYEKQNDREPRQLNTFFRAHGQCS